MKTKLATSGTLEGIKKLIAEFYAGEAKTLIEVSPGRYQVQGKGGILTPQVHVIRGRFVFGVP